MDKIYKKGKKLIIEVNLIAHRSNPYDKKENSEMDNILGVICGDEIGFAHWIDMSYVGKADQISRLFYLYNGNEKSFRKLCKDLGIYCYEYPICAYCGKPIFGAFTIGKKGNQCFVCEKELEKDVSTTLETNKRNVAKAIHFILTKTDEMLDKIDASTGSYELKKLLKNLKPLIKLLEELKKEWGLT